MTAASQLLRPWSYINAYVAHQLNLEFAWRSDDRHKKNNLHIYIIESGITITVKKKILAWLFGAGVMLNIEPLYYTWCTSTSHTPLPRIPWDEY